MTNIFRLDDTVEVAQKKINSNQVARLINSHLLRSGILTLNEHHIVLRLDSIQLLNFRRFDLMAKYIYAKFREFNIDSDWGYRLYCEHIRVFNNFNEGDDSGKQGKKAFVDTFNQILDSIQNNNFDESISLIPVSNENLIIDGSHRVAASIFYNRTLSVLNFAVKPSIFDFRFFLMKGLEQKWTDAMAFEYCYLKKNTFVVVVFPSARGRDSQIQEILQQRGEIVYEKTIRLWGQGPVNLIQQIYEGEPWLGDWDDQFIGARNKARACFRYEGPVRVFLYEAGSLSIVQSAKKEIRELFGIGNDSVHINDTHEETIQLAKIFFNDNSIHFLNHSHPKCFNNFLGLFIKYKTWIKENKNNEHFCIDGSAILSAYGIREAQDLDFLHNLDNEPSTPNSAISSHNGEIDYHVRTRDDIIFNPENHFYYRGVKFATLRVIQDMKEKRSEPKDKEDLRLIDMYLSSKRNQKSFFIYYPSRILNRWKLYEALQLQRHYIHKFRNAISYRIKHFLSKFRY